MTPAMTSLSIVGKCIWLTRPLGTPSELPQRLEQLGARVLQAPLLDIRPLGEDHPALQVALGRAQQLRQYRHIIFVSGNAVRCGMELISRYWPVLPTGLRWYAMGKSTACQLAKFGVEVQHPSGPQMDTEALLVLPGLQAVTGERVLIVRGVGGRETLAQVLRARGAEVDYLEAYQRVKSDTLPDKVHREIGAGAVDFVVAASGETISALMALAAPGQYRHAVTIAVVVPGERVALLARKMGFKRVVVAANASDDAMLEAMIGATQQQG
jgi:uroporphyrinogen-III synthase